MTRPSNSPLIASLVKLVTRMINDAPKPHVRALVKAVNTDGTVDLYWGGTGPASTTPIVVSHVKVNRLYTPTAGDWVIVDLLDGGDQVVAFPI